MNIKKLFVLIFAIVANECYAYDFSAVCSTGQTLYYNITSDSTVEVTYKQYYSAVGTFYYYSNASVTVNYTSYYDDGSYFETGSIYDRWIIFHQNEAVKPSGFVVIPDSVNGYQVTKIGSYAFFDCTGIDSLYIGSNVISIGGCAFQGCTGLSYMYYNASNLVTSHFMDSAYDYYNYHHEFPQNTDDRYSPFHLTSTPNFTTLIIGDSVRTIPAFCFSGRSSIDSILVIPNNVITIGESAFRGCSGIDSLYIGNGINTIPNGAFLFCSDVKKLVISNTVTSIGQSAFEECSGIHNLVIPEGVICIAQNAFANCYTMDSITFNAKECMIMNGNSVFAGCDSVRYFMIGENVHRFPDSAFTKFNHLIDSFPNLDSLRYVGKWNFSNWRHTGNLNIPSCVDTIAEYAFFNCENILSVSTNALYISNNAFATCDRLSQVILIDSVQTIGDSAFLNCDNLLTVSTNAQSIGYMTFADCDSLLTVHANTQSIGRYAFTNCDRLVSVTLGDSVQTLGRGVFSGCFRLNNVSAQQPCHYWDTGV